MGVALGACLAVLSAIYPPLALLCITPVLAISIWRWPDQLLEAAVFAILVVRPSLDIFSERRFGLGPFAPNPAASFGLMMLFVGLVFLLRRLHNRQPVWPDSMLLHAHLWLFAAYVLGLISGTRLFGSQGAAEGLRELLRVLSMVAAFLMTVWWASGSATRFRRGWSYLAAGAVVPIGVAIWQYATGSGYLETEGFNRLQGTFSHPNSLGLYLVPFILVALAGIPAASGKGRVIRLLLAAGLTWLVALTYSRTSLGILGAGLLVLPLLHARVLGWRGLIRAAALVGVLTLVGWLLAGNLIKQRFEGIDISFDAIEAAEEGVSENSFTWRLINWGLLISKGREHPVTGHGTGMTTVLNPLVNSDNGVPFNAHNDFVRFFFETGMVGLLCYAMYGLVLIRWGLRRARHLPLSRAPQGYGVVASLAAAFFLTAGIPELSLNTAVLYQMQGMLALMLADQKTPGGGV